VVTTKALTGLVFNPQDRDRTHDDTVTAA